MGFGQRIRFAFRAFFSLLFHGTLAADIAAVASPAPAREGTPGRADASSAVAAAPTPIAVPDRGSAADGAVQVLALLQRDARLLDFLMEDITGYPDAQIGAAVRDVHASSRRTLGQYVDLEPVLDGIEDQSVTLPAVDPAEVKIVGRTTGTPPLRGILRHRGWRAGRVALPPLPPASARHIVAPAEVEVS